MNRQTFRWPSRLLWLLAACAGLSDSDRRAVRTWLLCDECAPGDLTAVANLGDAAVPLLDTAIRILPQDREQLRRTLIETYSRISPIPATEAEYVARHLGNFDALVQIRAAVALGEIDTPTSRDALRRAIDSADVRGYRTDVLAKIENALVKSQYAAFAGSFEPETVAFLDTVVVSQGAGLLWNGDEQIHVTGAPFPNDTLVPRTTDTLKFLAVANVGDHAVLITRLGTGADTQVARLVVGRLSYESHSGATAPNLTASTFPPINPLYLTLGSRFGDTTDFFRLEAGAEFDVTARLDWVGLSSPTLSWHSCPPPYHLALLPNGVRGAILNEEGIPVGGAIVDIPPFVSAVITDSLGEFEFLGPLPGGPIWQLRVRAIGYRQLTYYAQRAMGRHVATLIRVGRTGATARNTRTSLTTIPAGGCRLLRVMSSSTSGTLVARLRFTSP